ncbi:MAG: radical SAM protein [Patescibacteria group bacterium]
MYKITSPHDILLILPPKRFKEHRYSLGLMYISGYLRDHGYDNTIIESKIFGGKDYQYDREKAREEIIEIVVRLKPKIIGFTSTTIEINEVIWLNREIRSKIDSHSIIGGSHATAMPEQTLLSGFEAVVLGEGEETTLELVRELEKDKPNLSSVGGIAWLDRGSNRVVINKSREQIDISQLSLPAYDKINMDYHTRLGDDIIRGFPIRAAMVMASRGCPYSCTFCGCNRIFGHQIRYRSLDNIKEEIKLLRDKYGVEGIWFADDTLTVSYDHVQKVCDIMKELGMYWGAQSRVDLTNEKMVKLMSSSGCLQLDFGVESGNQRVLDKIINKRIKLAEVEKAFILCRKYHLRTQASFMIGFPTETKEEMEDTFRFAQKIKPDYYSFNILMPLPGTEIYEKYFKGEITLADYEDVNFHKTKDKFNKSQVKDLNRLHAQWRSKLFEGVKIRSLIHPLKVLVLFLRLGHKRERVKFIGFKIKRATKYFLNKLGFKFVL